MKNPIAMIVVAALNLGQLSGCTVVGIAIGGKIDGRPKTVPPAALANAGVVGQELELGLHDGRKFRCRVEQVVDGGLVVSRAYLDEILATSRRNTVRTEEVESVSVLSRGEGRELGLLIGVGVDLAMAIWIASNFGTGS